MTKKEMEAHHRCDLQDKDRKIKELEDCIIALIQTNSYIKVDYSCALRRERKFGEGDYDLDMSPWNFSGCSTRHVAGVEHYPELLKQINVARDQLDKAARRACETLGRAQASVAIDPNAYERDELPEMIKQSVGFKVIGDAVYEAQRILEERVKEQEETNEQSKAA